MDNILKYIGDNRDKFIDRLRENVEIASVSGWPTHRGECVRQMEVSMKMLKDFGFDVERLDIRCYKCSITRLNSGIRKLSSLIIFF